MKINTAAALAALGIVVVLSGCAASETPTQKTPDAVAETPAAEDPSDEPTWAAPAICQDIDLTPDVIVPGSVLGGCVAEALPSFVTGKEFVETSMQSGEVVFRYRGTELDMQGGSDGDAGTTQFTMLDGTMWMDSGSGWVKGDVNSDDQEAQMIGATAEIFRTYADPVHYADLISAGAEWRVGAAESVTLGNGENIEAYPIAVTAPFTWNDIPVTASLAWFAEGWVPVGVRGTVEMFGMTETTTQTWYELGEPVEIVPVE